MAATGQLRASLLSSSQSSSSRVQVPFVGATLPTRVHSKASVNRRTQKAVCAGAATEEAVKTVGLGKDQWNSTYYPTGQDAANLYKPWFIIDAEGQTLGRLATLAATHIRGKTSPAYTPSMDMGAYVIIINAEKVTVTGRKYDDKLYRRVNVGRPGSMKVETFKDLQARIPERIIEKAVKGMLPKGRIGSTLFNHLKVFKGATHPHEAQTPINITHKISKKPSESV